MPMESTSPAGPAAEPLADGRPARGDAGPALAVLGGDESRLRGPGEGYPALLGRALGGEVHDLCLPLASPEAYLRDPARVARAQGAGACVVAAMGAANLSNRLYAVHPRRNDRFVRPAPALRVLFPEVDFADICFTRHLLLELRDAAPDRWSIVREELRIAWVARMRTLFGRLPPSVLLWTPSGEETGEEPGEGMLGPDPLFVTADMVEALRPLAAEVVTVPQPPRPGPEDHARLARALLGPVGALLEGAAARGAA